MAASQDTEITLGTGKLLALFFGLVGLCAVFFGLGFTFGKSSVPLATYSTTAPTTSSSARPDATKPPVNSSPANLGFYKAVEQKDSDAQLTAKAEPKPDAPATAESNAQAPDPAVPPPLNGSYYLQVAAVTKQEDADALVDALKKKQYSAFSAPSTSDKLFHVQVGPISDLKEAENMRAKLTGDGYSPILKK